MPFIARFTTFHALATLPDVSISFFATVGAPLTPSLPLMIARMPIVFLVAHPGAFCTLAAVPRVESEKAFKIHPKPRVSGQIGTTV